MRHGKKYNKLSRTASHRDAMLANMASSLIMHKRITTTLAKAKALRKYVEPLLTKSKTDSTQSRRIVFAYLNDKDAVAELFKGVAVKIGGRPGGYTRILKTGFRPGDKSEMCFIELVDYNEAMLNAGKPAKTEAAKPKTRRSSKKTTASAASENQSNAPSTEEAKPKKKAAKKKED